jgi:hypothetical protein
LFASTRSRASLALTTRMRASALGTESRYLAPAGRVTQACGQPNRYDSLWQLIATNCHNNVGVSSPSETVLNDRLSFAESQMTDKGVLSVPEWVAGTDTYNRESGNRAKAKRALAQQGR